MRNKKDGFLVDYFIDDISNKAEEELLKVSFFFQSRARLNLHLDYVLIKGLIVNEKKALSTIYPIHNIRKILVTDVSKT